MDRWSVLLTYLTSPRSSSVIETETEIETDRWIDTCTVHKSRADAVETLGACSIHPHIISHLMSSLRHALEESTHTI